jgi:hypothetical protein
MSEGNQEALADCLERLEVAAARLKSLAAETFQEVTDEELRAEAGRRGYVLNSRQFWEVAAQAIRFKEAVESGARISSPPITEHDR